MDDFTNPVMSAVESGDQKALERAVGADKPQQLRTCGSNAIQHPEGTVSFLLDEYRRRPAEAEHR
ncbi:hypothetical protein [Paraburkholderia aromaticivorans]|nr:hypothetical protein [Paraburkholderia aromaticivorans]